MEQKILTMYEQAQKYVLLDGYSVMPVGLDKRPLLKSWKFLQERLPTENELKEWFVEQFPKGNIGIVTGKVSNLTVLDIDNYKNGSIDATIFPATFTTRTGNGGLHLWYDYQEGISISAGAFPQFPNLDIRGEGGFIVAPPSITSYKKDGKDSGGEYVVINNVPTVSFPANLFPKKKAGKKLTQVVGTNEGGRNDSLASFAGRLLTTAKEEDWATEVLTAVLRVNKTYTPPLSEEEVKTTFNSICTKEKYRRSLLVVSPLQMTEENNSDDIVVRKNSSGTPYKDMANVIAVLSKHPYYKDALRYNRFRQDVEYNGKPLEDADILKIQYFMQMDAGLHTMSKSEVHSAIMHYANKHSYDEAQDWIKSLEWDGVERLKSWVHNATGVSYDAYHTGIGSQWLMGMIRRIMEPGCIFDYVLVLTGKQGAGKTSLFRIIGGPFYKSYTGSMDNKDFYLALRGAMIVDLDEGAAMYKSEAIKIKSIISDTHDEYRAPYDRVMKKYPRRFVFSMSTNDSEPFRDTTGNRRYWSIDVKKTIDFKWLEENREQLFAETYHYYKEKIKIPEVPLDMALANQEDHLPDDSWNDLVVREVRKSYEYITGDPAYSTTITDVYSAIFGSEKLDRLARGQEMRIGNILRKDLGMEKRRTRVNGERSNRWYISEEKLKELQDNNAPKTVNPFDEF